MHRIEVLIVFFLVAFAQGTNSSPFSKWQSSWIEGGSDAAPGEFPFMVSVRNRKPDTTTNCGGSIVNYWYILTAAHCVLGATIAKITVLVGTNKLSGGGQTYGVSRIIMHEAYDRSQGSNDIALLKLVTSVVYSATVKPVRLPNQDETTAMGMGCFSMGWGRTSSSATTFPDNLQKLLFDIISNDICKKYYTFFLDTKICASAASGKGTCQGDSGGPLICGGKQVGVLRGGGKPGSICSTPFPTEFTNVAKYIDWIKQHAV